SGAADCRRAASRSPAAPVAARDQRRGRARHPRGRNRRLRRRDAPALDRRARARDAWARGGGRRRVRARQPRARARRARVGAPRPPRVRRPRGHRAFVRRRAPAPHRLPPDVPRGGATRRLGRGGRGRRGEVLRGRAAAGGRVADGAARSGAASRGPAERVALVPYRAPLSACTPPAVRRASVRRDDECAAGNGLRRRRLASVPARRRCALDRLGGVCAPVVRARLRRVHRAGVSRGGGASRDRAQRPQAGDVALPPAAAVARQARGDAASREPRPRRHPCGTRRLRLPPSPRGGGTGPAPGRRAQAGGGPGDAAEANLSRAFKFLAETQPVLPAGTFVFVLSDFLMPFDEAAWIGAVERRWDLVPVVIQDPVWERSFPDVGGVVLPFLDHTSGRFVTVRLTDWEAARMREANQQRAAELLARFRNHDLGPVLVTTSDRMDIFEAFLEWADERIVSRGQWW